ncbi:hypothetical protein HUT00_35960, partial [Pseudomonas chlororaphis]|nr:hypothetical protein [Pseudomonas chlororaphis]
MSPAEPVTGLILSGGGARAAYQVGVLAAMQENDFQVGNDGSIGFGGGVTGNFAQFARWTGD